MLFFDGNLEQEHVFLHIVQVQGKKYVYLKSSF